MLSEKAGTGISIDSGVLTALGMREQGIAVMRCSVQTFGDCVDLGEEMGFGSAGAARGRST